jgi:hypothetical protein
MEAAMPEQGIEPGAAAWGWQRGGAAGSGQAERAREAAAARRQGLIGGAIGLAAAAVFALVLHRPVLAAVVAAIALASAVAAAAAPLTLYRRLARVFELLGLAAGTALTWVLMTILYYLLFLPVGLVMRAAGKLTFTRFRNPRAASYWTTTDGRTRSAESYRHQF